MMWHLDPLLRNDSKVSSHIRAVAKWWLCKQWPLHGNDLKTAIEKWSKRLPREAEIEIWGTVFSVRYVPRFCKQDESRRIRSHAKSPFLKEAIWIPEGITGPPCSWGIWIQGPGPPSWRSLKWDSKIWSANCTSKLQIRLLVREGASQHEDHRDRLTDCRTKITWTWS
jgi:hypothetical protein